MGGVRLSAKLQIRLATMAVAAGLGRQAGPDQHARMASPCVRAARPAGRTPAVARRVVTPIRRSWAWARVVAASTVTDGGQPRMRDEEGDSSCALRCRGHAELALERAWQMVAPAGRPATFLGRYGSRPASRAGWLPGARLARGCRLPARAVSLARSIWTRSRGCLHCAGFGDRSTKRPSMH
jgi:hypothetical protein